jgi:hypothetical protein
MSADIPETERKLREAQFFLGCMQAEERKTVREPEVFRFYLSAFLSAGRSVTFRLQNEVGGRYRPWFDEWLMRQSEDERKFLTFMNDQRRAEVHMLGSETTQQTEMVPLHLTDRSVGRHPAHMSSSSAPPGTPHTTIGVVAHAFTESGERTVVAGGRYLELLDGLVSDYRGDHP